MRILQILPLILFSYSALGQSLSGVMLDSNSGDTLPGVSIRGSSMKTISDRSGKFKLGHINIGDTIQFAHVGYKNLSYVVGEIDSATLKIRLEPTTILLEEVYIMGARDYKSDSLRFRKDFAKVFEFKQPKFTDIFISKADFSTDPKPYYQASQSTASLISVNILSLVGFVGKSNFPQSKLQQRLLKEEENSFLERIFPASLVEDVTGLKGDSLHTFIDLYKPAPEKVKDMSDYEIIMYIKTKYREYSRKKGK